MGASETQNDVSSSRNLTPSEWQALVMDESANKSPSSLVVIKVVVNIEGLTRIPRNVKVDKDNWFCYDDKFTDKMFDEIDDGPRKGEFFVDVIFNVLLIIVLLF